MKKLNKIFVVLLIAIAFMLLLSVKTSAAVDSSRVPAKVKDITFDSSFYIALNPDVEKVFGTNEADVYYHYLNFGIKEGRQGSAAFSIKYYLNNYTDLVNTFGSNYEDAYIHFIKFGLSEGRTGSNLYNSSFYLSKYTDLQNAYGKDYTELYTHFVRYGEYEGRQGSESFVVSCYLNKYADLVKAFGSIGYKKAYNHYVIWGISEGRVGVHEYEVTSTTEATCIEAGSIVYECACGDTYSEVIEATGHDYEYVAATTVDCTTGGVAAHYVCATCGNLFAVGSYANVSLASLTVGAKGHTWGDGVVTKEATCAEAGETTYTCTVCGTTKTEEIEKTEHDMVKVEAVEATCETEGNVEYYYCKNEVDENGNPTTYYANEAGTTTLSEEDIVTETIDHTWDEGTITTAATCTEDGEITYTCTVCGETTTETSETTGHTLKEVSAVAATCTEEGNSAYYKCTECGKIFADANGKYETTLDNTVLEATGHTSYSDWASIYSAENTLAGSYTSCSENEEYLSDPTTTDYVQYRFCEVCGLMEYRTLQDILDELSEGDSYTAQYYEVASTLTIPSGITLTIEGKLSDVTITNNGSLIIDGDENANIASNSVTITNATGAIVTANVLTGDGFVAMATWGEDVTIEVNSDISVGSAFNVSSGDVIVDLNGNELEYVYSSGSTVSDSASLTMENGTFTDGYSSRAGNSTVFKAAKGSSITFKAVTGTSGGTFLYPQGNAAEVNVINCELTGGEYVIGTNAGKDEYYGITINVENSTLTASQATGDGGCGVLINVEGTLNITDSYIYGTRQGVIVRAGTANIENSTVTCLGTWYDEGNTTAYANIMSGKWASGQEIPSAAIVIGNYNSASAYKANADCTLSNVTLEVSKNDTVLPEIYLAKTNNSYATSVNIYQNSVAYSGNNFMAKIYDDVDYFVTVNGTQISSSVDTITDLTDFFGND